VGMSCNYTLPQSFRLAASCELVASLGQCIASRFAKNTFTIQPQTFACNRNDLQGNQFCPTTHFLSRFVAEIALC